MQVSFGPSLRVLHWRTDSHISDALAEMDITSAQGHVMCYLALQDTPPCPRDVEAALQLSHPTVSGILCRLARKGFLQIRLDTADRRCKRIHLLPKGQACISCMEQTISGIEQRIVQGFSEEEKRHFADFLNRAIINMGGDPCCPPGKEASNQS